MHPFRQYWDPNPENIAKVTASIGPVDRVLDVGGWWKPLSRADVVVDMMPYESRGGGGRIGPGTERFDASSWVQTDICAAPLPFPDKSFDFAYCGQTLEDIRDPLSLCRELQRVARRGYIEVPTPWIECQYGVDDGEFSSMYPGYDKHRWLVSIRAGELLFVPKLAWLGLFQFADTETVARYIHCRAMWTDAMLWSDSFRFAEMPFSGINEIVPELRRYFEEFDYSRCGSGR